MTNLLLLQPPQWAVPAASGYDFYTLFYVLAFGLNLALLVWEGHRRAYPMRTWLVLLACTTLTFILGTKLVAFSGPEWQQLLTTGQWPASGARSVLGGALAGTLTLLALRRPLGFSRHVFDAFALPMCAALVIQCVGCVLTGCCFGEPTAGGWGLTYPPGTLPYFAQLYQGLIPAGAAHSLPVHPTQLYSLLLCALVGAVLLLTRHRAWPGGSRHFLQLGLLLAGRFIIEFWREPAGEPVGALAHTHAGISMLQLQWVLLPLILLTLGIWLWQIQRTARPEQAPTQNPVRNLLAVAGLLLLTAWLGPLALTLPEVLVLKALLLAVLVLEGGALLLGAADATRPLRVALPLGLACVVLVLTSQAPIDSTQTARRETYTTIGVGGSAGSFDRLQNTEGGCGSNSELLPYRHRYATGTLDVSRTQLPGADKDGDLHRAEATIGVRVHVGSDQQTAPLFPDSLGLGLRKKTLLLSINPYVRLDRQWVGVGLGVLVGNLGYHKFRFGDEISAFDLQGSLRVGPRETLFGQADYNYLGYGTGNPQQRLGLGTGFGGTRWQLLAGAASAKDYQVLEGMSRWSGFVEAQGQLTPKWQAGTFLTLGNRHQQQVGLRLSRRLSARR